MRVFSLIASGCLFASSASAAVFKVGDIAADSCDFATIQEAIDAAAANGPEVDTILIANSGSYTGQALLVGDQSLQMEGGFDSCSSPQSASAADIVGDARNPVFWIAPEALGPQQITLRGLHVRGGGSTDAFGSSGGGIYVKNNVLLTIADTLVEQNAALSGGGIYVEQIGAAVPVVHLEAGAQIRDNHAIYYGGGIYLSGGRLEIVADQVAIEGNRADAVGGGIAATNGVVSIGNPGSLPARSDVSGASVSHNSAGTFGGGIYITGPAAVLTAHELIVDGNSATNGGGGLVASEQAQLTMQRDYTDAPAWQCANAGECSRISNNSVGASASGTVGGAIALYSHAQADLAQTIIRGNTAQDGSVASVDTATLRLESVLATKNRAFDTATHSGSALRTQFLIADGPAIVRVAYTTFADNVRRDTAGDDVPALDIVAQQNSQLSIYSSAFYDGPSSVTTYSGYTDDCVVETFGSSGYYGTHTRLLMTATPGFNDVDDFRLRTDSTLNDYCDASMFTATHRDLVLTPRCHDDPRKLNAYGMCDVGAYESDHVFGSGLE